MSIKQLGFWLLLPTILASKDCLAQKNNHFPNAEDPLHVKAKMYEALTLENH
jgi:hypothetical protein